MSSTIVDRIKAEKSQRQKRRNAIQGVVAGQPESEPRQEEGDSAALFLKDMVPALGQTISREMSSSLGRVREELVGCLSREISQLIVLPPSSSSLDQDRKDEYENAQHDTDVELLPEEIRKGIDQSLDEALPELTSGVEKEPTGTFEESPEDTLAETREISVLGNLDLPAEKPPPKTLQGDAEESADPPRPVAVAVAAEPSPPPPVGEASVQEEPGDVVPESSLTQFDTLLDQLKEALIPGIAEGIAQMAEGLENAQVGISDELANLSRKVAGIQARIGESEAPEALRTPETPETPEIDLPEPSPDPPVAGEPAESIQEAAGTVDTSLEEVKEAILAALREMEGRIVLHLDSLDGQKGQHC